MSDTKKGRESPPAKYQNIKIYMWKHVGWRRICSVNADANPGAVTRHMQENLWLCQKLKITVISGFRTKLPWWPNTVRKLLCIAVVSGYRTKITVVTNYRATTTVHYRGGWLPYKVFRGCQLPSTNYWAIPWWLLTAANVTKMKKRYRGKPWIFPSMFCTIPAFSLYGECVVRYFFPNVTTGWIFYISLCESSNS